jgi:hypothetical protein
MATIAHARFGELITGARIALAELSGAAAAGDAHALLRAVSAASLAAGFIQALTISDPVAAAPMVVEFESLVSGFKGAAEAAPSEMARA